MPTVRKRGMPFKLQNEPFNYSNETVYAQGREAAKKFSKLLAPKIKIKLTIEEMRERNRLKKEQEDKVKTIPAEKHPLDKLILAHYRKVKSIGEKENKLIRNGY